ncbi:MULTISPECIES: sensor histidine kinase [unclassified Marinomonas]|jgi:signal transduction histidine kinase|uniref:sensor histidine kinase n=1 Tax=unclassified Marinomonas TaxID=196814 RepID=UPI000C1E4A40|nr:MULTISPECIES: HAMP domain-containing sensor histidine kinase [unclassified Marinomonas]PJE55178.1 histidine kinase [Marinomonas sp. BSi20584]
MERLFKGNTWLSKFKLWVLYGFIAFIIAITIAVFGIITYTSDSSKNNSRRVFESSLWNTLQLQIQSYRFLNYLIALEDSDYPLNGNAFFEYDLLMSRVDLLRQGDVGSLIRTFEGGRTTRLLNIINGELELLSFNLSKIENGDTSYLPDLIERIQRIEDQINEFVTLVNKGSNEFISNQHRTLQKNLDDIQLLSMALLACLLCLCFFTVKGLTELKNVIRRNKDLKLGIQTINEDKANLLSFVNQEIRSPINAILGTAKTLNCTTSKNDIKVLSKHIDESGHQLLQTIEMLSDLALIDAKQLTLNPTIEYLQNSVEDCLAIFEPQMARKNLQSILYIDPLLPKDISLDFIRTKEIIVALLQNAITHTPSGSISLQIRPSALSAPQMPLATDTKEIRVLQIALRDTGLGMPNELQQNLRVNPYLPMQKEGPLPSKVGLSLALCHKLVYLMQGEMHFSCAPQKGCEFWVDIPFYVPNDCPSTKQLNFQCPDQTQALIIETDIHLAKIISLQLAAFNIDAVISKDGSLQEYKNYDMVILGNTPRFERDGYDALQQWKTKSCPILGYHPQAVNNSEYPIMPLQFPLTQTQLEPLIASLFSYQITASQETSSKAHKND